MNTNKANLKNRYKEKYDINLVYPTSLAYLINIKIVRESLDNNFVNPTNKLY